MFVCDEKFLREFDSRWEGEYLCEVEGDRVNLLQVSDIHWEPGASLEGRQRTLQKQLRLWQHEAAVDKVHGVVMSGDVIDGSAHARASKSPVARRRFWDRLRRPAVDSAGERLRTSYREAHRSGAEVLSKALQCEYEMDAHRQKKSVLVVPGNHDVLRSAATLNRDPPHRWESFVEHFAPTFTGGVPTTTDRKTVEFPRLCLYGNESGILALFGLDSNYLVYEHGEPKWFDHAMVHHEQLSNFRATVERLHENVADRPLYIVVSLHHHLLPVIEPTYDRPLDLQEDLKRVTLDTRSIIEELQASCSSLVLHGHMHQHTVQQVSYLTATVGAQRSPLSIISCGCYQNVYKSAIISADLYWAKARIVMMLGRDDMQGAVKDPLETSVSLVSASRVPSGEMRLYREMRAWLEPAPNRAQLPSGRNREDMLRPDPVKAAHFADLVERRWKDIPYVPLCSRTIDGVAVPFPADPDLLTKHKQYFLLLVLKDQHVLLNNHQALRYSDYAQWDTLLLPSFKTLFDFFDRARWDLVRLRGRHRIDSTRSETSRSKMEKKIEGILGQTSGRQWDEWEAKLRFLGAKTFVKFSPTDAVPQIYDYTLVSFDGFCVPGGPAEALELLPELDAADVIDREVRRRGKIQPPEGSGNERDFDPGYCWFPRARWRECASIVARNEDVMDWAMGILDRIEVEHGYIPPWLRWKGANRLDSVAIDVSKQCPFDEDGRDADGFPNSLKFGLGEMKLGKGPLQKHYAYARTGNSGKDICRISSVYLKNIELTKGKPQILVHECVGRSVGKRLGFLRPTQRYALRQGLDRAKLLAAEIRRADLKDDNGNVLDPLDFEGYLKLKLPGGMSIAHLPPVIETIQEAERENSQGEEEFLVCDGNHRIIQHCLRSDDPGTRVRAVLIRDPPYPYYAFPFSAKEWWVTAKNVVSFPPDLYSKYAPRQYSDEDDPLSYRAYFREFGGENGFINIGGQGGRMV
jgi:3',5'-cyclic AMP phosphodiesterase CpdA